MADAAALALAAQLENARFNLANASYDPLSAAAVQSMNPSIKIQAQNQLAQLDASNELAKHNLAFSQPRDDLAAARTPGVIAGEQAYAAQRGLTVGSGGTYTQSSSIPSATNPYNPNSAAGIAWDVARTGGATDLRMNAIATREVVAQGGNPNFITYATDIYAERPSYQQQVLTTKTGEQFTNPSWSGVPIRLNMTLGEMSSGVSGTPGTGLNYLRYNPETYNLENIGTNKAIDVDTGVHTRYGDFGGPRLIGNTYGGWSGNNSLSGLAKNVAASNVKGESVGITPSSPLGVELGMAEGSIPKPFSSVGKSGEFGISEATGAFPIVGVVPGFSNVYAFFQPGTKTTQVVGSPISQPVSSVIGTPVVTTETIGGTTYTTTTTPTTTTGGTVTPITTISSPTESGYDRLNATIRGTLNLPSKEEGEVAVRAASLFMPTLGGQVIGSVISEKLTGSKAGQTFEPLRGQYTQFYDQPILAPISYAVGAGFGVLGEGASVIGAAGKANIAERVISSGGSYRAADMFISKVSGAVPYVLGGAYVVDIAGRSTKGFTEYAPENVASSAKGIAVQEAFPMMLGFGLPKQIVSGVSLAEQGYKQALERGTQIASTEAPKGIDKVLDLSGTTTGRFDYYVKQPAMKPYEMLKSDFASFQQENVRKIPIGEVTDATDNIPLSGLKTELQYRTEIPGKWSYVVERGGFNVVPEATPTTLKYTPAQTGELAELAYGKQSTIFDIAKSRFDILPKSEPISLKYAPPEIPTGYQAEAAYGKQKTVFDIASESLTSAGKFTYKTMGFGKEITVSEPHVYSRYMSESSALKLGTKAYPAPEPYGIKIKSYIQENEPFKPLKETWDIYLRHPLSGPSTEISNINKMFAVQKETGIMGIGGSGSEAGVGKFTTGFGSGGITPTTKFGGGAAGTTQPRSMGFKTVGGKQVGGLSPERSLKSLGVSSASEKPGSLGFAKQRTTDFGKPLSEKMKPMGEQAKGTKQATGQIQIMREQLPQVEGMTRGQPFKGSTPQSMFSPQLLQQRVGQKQDFLQVIEPTSEVSQAVERRQMIAPISLMGQTSSQLQSLRIGSEVITASKQETRQQRASLFAQDVSKITTPSYRFADISGIKATERQSATERTQKQEVTPVSDITFITGYKQKTDQIVTPTQETKYKEVVDITQIKFPGLPSGSLGGGGGGGGGGRLGGFGFTEKLSVRSAREIMFGASPKVNKGKR